MPLSQGNILRILKILCGVIIFKREVIPLPKGNNDYPSRFCGLLLKEGCDIVIDFPKHVY